MSKSIQSLVKDIETTLVTPQVIPAATTNAFGQQLASMIADRLGERKARKLSLSQVGQRCDRKLWYSNNRPELAEPLPPATRMKFLFGDILELLLLFLARVAGHEVTDEQKEVQIDGVLGHIDGRIDGHLVDSKSSSTPSFAKFVDGLTVHNDSFGYLGQLGAYAVADNHDTASFLAIDKQLGHIVLDTHKFDPETVKAQVSHAKEVVGRTTIPYRGFADEQDGVSGNRKLGTECSYCSWKRECWPGLRTFSYSGSPRFLTRVARIPKRKDGTAIPEL